MNKEEQEAIEYIKELIKPPLRPEWDFAYKLDKTTAKQFKILINYIKKLQKENKELKDSLERDIYARDCLAKHSVSKNKIREQIQVFKKEGSQTSLIIASVLKELLEED